MSLLSRPLVMFLAVAEQLHFGLAAARLNMTQPPLSQHIRELESQLGAQLFVRTTRSVQLTAAGRILLERGRRLVADADAIEAALQRANAGDVGTLSLGFVHSAAYELLPKVLATYQAAHPDVNLELTELTSNDLVEALLSRRIDVALLRASTSMQRSNLAFLPVVREPMVLALPKDHNLTALKNVPIKRLDGAPFIGFSPTGALYFKELIEAIFEYGHVQPRIVYESRLPTLLALVEAGMGIAIVPASACWMRPEQLSYRPLKIPKSVGTATLHCARRYGEINPSVDNFWRTVHEIGRC